MKFIAFMLGTSLLKKESKISKSDKESRRLRKKNSVEYFLRRALGNGLLEKKF